MHARLTRTAFVLVVTALAVAGVACGDAAGTKKVAASASTTVATASAATASAAAKPVVSVPSGPAPTQLQSADVTVGTGAEAVAGKKVTVQYVGVAYSTKTQFDASWDRGQPFSFGLGSGQVIKGWDQGVVGMKVGGRRTLIIPPDLGYGDRGSGATIKPGETLVFTIDLLSVS